MMLIILQLMKHFMILKQQIVLQMQSNVLYFISKKDCIEFIYYVNNICGKQLSHTENPQLKEYVQNNSTVVFSIVNAIYSNNSLNGWVRDDELIPDKSSDKDSTYYEGNISLNTANPKKSYTYVLVANFQAYVQSHNNNGPLVGNRGGAGGKDGGGVDGSPRGWIFDLKGFSYFGYSQNG